jgi:hypothetical protein
VEERGRTGYLVLNLRGNGLTKAGGDGQNLISCPQSKRQWIDIRRRSRQNLISCPQSKRQWIDIRWRRGAELDILSSLQ